VWSTAPSDRGFRFGDVSAVAEAKTPVLDVVGDFHGRARVDGYTVAHDHGEPRYAAVLARTDDDRRVVARCDDITLASAMVADEWCGREIAVDGDRFSGAG